MPTDHVAARSMCTACDRRPTLAPRLLCGSCEAALDADLRYIAAGYPQLDPEPGSQPLRAGTTHQAPGPRSPARDDVLSLTDPRPRAFDPDTAETRAQSLLGLVRHWVAELLVDGILDADDLRSRTFVVAPDGPVTAQRRAVAAEAYVLAARTSILARHWSVGELARQCAAQARALRRALGEDRQQIVVGACPDLTITGGECGGRLVTVGWGSPVRCAACGMRWAGEPALRALGIALGGALFDMPGLVRYLGMEGREATLRKWASRDQWRRERSPSGRTVYALDDALASWWAAYDREHAPDVPPPPPAAAADVVELPLPRVAVDEQLIAA